MKSGPTNGMRTGLEFQQG